MYYFVWASRGTTFGLTRIFPGKYLNYFRAMQLAYVFDAQPFFQTCKSLKVQHRAWVLVNTLD